MEIEAVKESFRKENPPSQSQKLFELALGLDLNEPARYEFLRRSVEGCDAPYPWAGIYLGNLYDNGVVLNGAELLPQDYEKARKCYEAAAKCDGTGVAAWLIGSGYEDENYGKGLDKLQREEIALQWYEKSAKYHYGKAYSSIGKFSLYGKGGKEADTIKATQEFDKAKECGDTFSAAINLAYAYKKEGRHDHADRLFAEAVDSKSPLAYYQYAEFLFTYGQAAGYSESEAMEKAKQNYENARHSCGLYSALSCYRLMVHYTDVDRSQLKKESIKGFEAFCSRGNTLRGEAETIYNILKA